MSAEPVESLTITVTLAVIQLHRSPGPGHYGVRDVAREAGLTLSTTHRHLRKAREAGLVDWVDNRTRTLHPLYATVPPT